MQRRFSARTDVVLNFRCRNPVNENVAGRNGGEELRLADAVPADEDGEFRQFERAHILNGPHWAHEVQVH